MENKDLGEEILLKLRNIQVNLEKLKVGGVENSRKELTNSSIP